MGMRLLMCWDASPHYIAARASAVFALCVS